MMYNTLKNQAGDILMESLFGAVILGAAFVGIAFATNSVMKAQHENLNNDLVVTQIIEYSENIGSTGFKDCVTEIDIRKGVKGDMASVAPTSGEDSGQMFVLDDSSGFTLGQSQQASSGAGGSQGAGQASSAQTAQTNTPARENPTANFNCANVVSAVVGDTELTSIRIAASASAKMVHSDKELNLGPNKR